MLRLLADENSSGAVVRGLVLKEADADLLRVQDVGLGGAAGPSILEWAAADGRIVLTHDVKTMPPYAYDRLGTGLRMPGVFVVPDRLPVGKAIQEILLLAACSRQEEWNGLVVYLPL